MSRLVVTDASVVVDLLGRFSPEPIEAILFEPGTRLLAPELLDIEVLNALRRLEMLGMVPAQRQTEVLDDFRALRIRRFRHAVLRQDIWRLRSNLTAYDACYVALARQSGAALVTRDERLAKAPDLGIEIEVP